MVSFFREGVEETLAFQNITLYKSRTLIIILNISTFYQSTQCACLDVLELFMFVSNPV